ncbi:hypothetical protein HIM_05332 [Hirsutella minnesotensis 3608]|uniref:SnoaL-like domain-containing protein n=1 Tax=Hirsutella minnesotensis 3608 TaxID=1043627 RepID=A0A0F7ZKM5_9HYPO|nr:hypothetical protein HIM_05332 [Hirsutella minnesotensis 3608]
MTASSPVQAKYSVTRKHRDTLIFISSQVASEDDMSPSEQHIKIRDTYLRVWGGEFDLADQIFDPSVKLNIDRHPSENGTAPVDADNLEKLLGFMKVCRHGWQKFGFNVRHCVAEGPYIALRWRAECVLGDDYPAPTALKSGDKVEWNGTDFLVLNGENKIVEVNIAQDMLELFKIMGATSVSI